MHHNKFVLCSAAAMLALAVACSKSSQTPASPTSVQDAGGTAAPDGSTLKTPAPTTVSPVNNAQPNTLELVAGRVSGTFDNTLNPSYEFEIRTTGGSPVSGCGRVVPPGSGNTVSYLPLCTLQFDATYTWRVRATYAGAFGPWSGDATFKAPAGGYINGNEVFDPLTTGRTVGAAVGGVSFIPGKGLQLLGHDSRVTYLLEPNLQAGEFSVMVTGFDEGSAGDKTKIISMQEGTGDLTANDYRFTLEKRGRAYSTPGAVTWRMIMGEADEHAGRIFDGSRVGVEFSDERWYFWKVTWGNRTSVEVREDGPRGRVLYESSRGTGGFAYRPVPHYIHLGAPVGRAGPGDASIPGAVYKNVWVSSRPRPQFPGE